jgi:hypothetical protein
MRSSSLVALSASLLSIQASAAALQAVPWFLFNGNPASPNVVGQEATVPQGSPISLNTNGQVPAVNLNPGGQGTPPLDVDSLEDTREASAVQYDTPPGPYDFLFDQSFTVNNALEATSPFRRAGIKLRVQQGGSTYECRPPPGRELYWTSNEAGKVSDSPMWIQAKRNQIY